MQAMWRRQCPRRIKYQPEEMKIVLMKLRDAFVAGRSEMLMKEDRIYRMKRIEQKQIQLILLILSTLLLRCLLRFWNQLRLRSRGNFTGARRKPIASAFAVPCASSSSPRFSRSPGAGGILPNAASEKNGVSASWKNCTSAAWKHRSAGSRWIRCAA